MCIRDRSGSISRGKNDPSQSLQMIGRPLMTPDELKSLPKGHFILAKTGCHPMRVELRLFFKWGIEFEEEYEVEQHVARPVSYAAVSYTHLDVYKRQMLGGYCSEQEYETWVKEPEKEPVSPQLNNS